MGKVRGQLTVAIGVTGWLAGTVSIATATEADGIFGVLERQALRRWPISQPWRNPAALKSYARTITVKILTGDQWSSGILIQRQGSVYTVLTNQHVLRTGESYRIQVADGQVYPATVSSFGGFADNDLATLNFRSERRYEIATLGSSLSLPVGTPVFAAGFPIPGLPSAAAGFTFTSGQVSLISPKVLEGGYQIGYTNLIEKGMSGGPVLNARGDVIAINGTHQEPLWGNPYRFADGSKPPTPLLKMFVNSSWAIPVETFIQFSANRP